VVALALSSDEDEVVPAWRDAGFFGAILLLACGGAAHLAAIVYGRRNRP
jgi:hypothetical protein